MRWLLGLAVVATILSPGVAIAEDVKVVLPPPLVSEPMAAGTSVQPVSLTRVAADIPAGTAWLQRMDPVYFLTPCMTSSEVLRWREEDNTVGSFDGLGRIFSDQLKATGLQTSGESRNLFEDQKGTDLQVGALVTGLKVRLCRTVTLVIKTSGQGSMDVEWQIFSVSQGRIIGRIATRGGAEIKDLNDPAEAQIISEAFADNVRRLTASAEFRRIVAEPTPSAPRTLDPIRFATPSAAAVPLSTAVKSVVLVFAGSGHGSGVLISDDGYILTNHHVAGDSGRVRVRWADGSESVGDVVRGDGRRDVALIKTTPRAAALAVRGGPVQLGEAVFAIGAPLRKEFANTLTRGIVSATRLVDGQTLIQSDVAVDRGNSGGPLLDEKGQVIALTVSGYRPDGVSHDINFFIPIDDALKALALTPAS